MSESTDSTTHTPSQILLEALQNFVIPLIHAANGKNKQDIDQIHLSSEAGKLLTALQEFISSMIIQSRVGHPQKIEVDLEAHNVDAAPPDDVMDESPDAIADRAVSGPGPSKEKYQRFMGKLQEAIREHVFRKMPIRLLHFIDTPRNSGTKLQITLLDRKTVSGRVIKKIQANFSEETFEERVESYRKKLKARSPWRDDDEQSTEDEVIEELVRENTKYSILSHTWLRGSASEVTYDDWHIGRFNTQQPGYQKLANFCESAWKDHGISFGWMDTVCINKDSSSELDESIRSMYKWYKSSDICITYLAGTATLDNIHRDPWFTRGWTFQELLAPEYMTFYSKDWNKFVPYTHPGDKSNADILAQISNATTITKTELYHPAWMSVSRKMQLAAVRNVMREEDIAYSLMGICGVSISTSYGEGAKRAFFRLMVEILNSSPKVVDIFNCAQENGSQGTSIIPLSPSAYLQRSKTIMAMRHYLPIEPLLLTHVGIRMPILLMPSLREDDSCLENKPMGDYYAMFHLPALYSWDIGPCHLLDNGITTSFSNDKWTFGILNFGGDATNIYIPDRCLAVCFQSSGHVEWNSTARSSSAIDRIGTQEPIVFHLKNQRYCTSGEGRHRYPLKRSELIKHGMTLTTMYL